MQGQKEENADAAETDDGTSGVKSGIKQSPLPSEDLIDWSCILKKEVLDTDSTSFVPDDGNSFVDLLNTIDSQYKDVIQFAEGGFCRIYKAKSRFLNRMVAVKSLKKHLAQNPEEVRKFIREAKLVAQLDHAGIVSVYDMLKDDDGGVHIAMKLINGKNLSELTYRLAESYRKYRVSATVERRALLGRLTVFLRICETVAYAHRRGIVHCDLKPGNITIAHDGAVYVMDWGSANPIGTKRKDQIDGTPRYIDAEAVYGKPILPENDIYALGMILAEIVTLRPCISGIESRDVVDKACEGDFEAVRHISRHLTISPRLVAIIEKARNPKARKRYKTVTALHDDVRHFMFSEEVSAAPDNLTQSVWRWFRVHRTTAAACFTACFIIFVSTIAVILLDKLKIADKSHKEMNERIVIQHRTRAVSEDIGQIIFDVSVKLRYFCLAFGMEYTDAEHCSTNAVLMSNDDFAANADFKKALPFSDFFRKRVSFEIPSVIIPDGIDKKTDKEQLPGLYNANKLAMALLLGTTEIVKTSDFASWDDTISDFLKNGAFAQNIFVLFDNDICLCYPGMYYDELPEQFYFGDAYRLQHSNPHATLWSIPTHDGAAPSIVSGVSPIQRPDGTIVARCVLNVRLSDLIKPILERLPSVQGHPYRCFILIDSLGRVVFSADTDSVNIRKAGNYPEVRLPADPELDRKIKQGAPEIQFHHDYKGHHCVVDWTYLPTLRWKLIQLAEPQFNYGLDHKTENAF